MRNLPRVRTRPCFVHVVATVVAVSGLALTAGCAGKAAVLPLPKVTAPVPGVTLPPDPLSPLVPSPNEVPAAMVPLLVATGPRDAHAIAAFSADPKTAGAALKAHHFARAYAAQYADPADGRVLSVVVSQFATAKDATTDYTSDLSSSGGSAVPTEPTVGDASDVRTQPLPGKVVGQLVTVRFRLGTHTWLIAYGARPVADPAVAVALAKTLAARG